MDRAWLGRPVLLDAEHERRAGDDAPNPELDAGVERSLLASGGIELEHACELWLRHRTTECAAGQCRENLRRTCVFLAADRGTAREDPLAARRRAGASGVERPGDRQRLDV